VLTNQVEKMGFVF